jgi:hypothetical protein
LTARSGEKLGFVWLFWVIHESCLSKWGIRLMTHIPKSARALTGVVIGVVVSCAVGILFYFQPSTATGLATLVALVGVTITLQLASLFQQNRSDEEQTRQQRIFSIAESIDWLPERIEAILNSAQKVQERYPGTLVTEVARREFDKCVDEMKKLQTGRHDTPFDDNRLSNEMTEKADEIQATSVDKIDLDWWQSPAGVEYWQRNVQAIARGCNITRIFIYEKKWTSAHESLARKQDKAGVHVKRIV